MKYIGNILLVVLSLILVLDVIFYVQKIVTIEALLLQIAAFVCFIGLYAVNLRKSEK